MTLKELSAQSGVSIATISRIINKRAGVSEENIQKVTKLIRQAGDENLLKKLEMGAGQKVIAVVVPDLSNPFFTAVIRGISAVLEKQRYNIIVCDAQESITRELEIISMLKNMDITGLVITPTSDSDGEGDKCEAALKALKIPVILVDRDVPKASFDGVFLDNEKGALIGVSHLIQKGHTNIAIITGPISSKPGRERLWGYKSAFARSGLSLNPENIYEGDFSRECAYELTCRILRREDRPTAIFSCNNMMTIGCLQALRDHAVIVGTDIDILGFDEIDDIADMGAQITCIRRATREMGQVAAELMLERLGTNVYSSNRRISLIPELRVSAAEREKKPLEGAIFDMDGTLLDTMGVWENAPLELLKSRGIACNEQMASTFHGMGFEAAANYLSQRYLPSSQPEELMDEIVRRVYLAYEHEVQPKPGAEALLQKLMEQDIPMALLTSNRRELVETVLRRLGWMKYFRRIVTAREYGKSKQNPEIFLYTASLLGVSPAHCAVFEDSLTPARTAASIGMRVFAVLDLATQADWPALQQLAAAASEKLEDLQTHICFSEDK